ncbi:hypothetical protein [Bremerella alba]|uniref:Uncharacterized protein n=1 Tax=Bremerella alba TaxID=980252 RepID=A0A7V8VAR3_9BACT|nr:hypothetical protein [Bremerella alba]MBA2117849.1 hypothetical protein [Bremerella alba]
MISDNVTHQSRLVPGELVPSRYAVRVGEIEVLIVSDGVLPLPTAMLGYNVAPALRVAWQKDMFLPADAFDWALNVVVVRSGEQTVVTMVCFIVLQTLHKTAKNLTKRDNEPSFSNERCDREK